MPFSSSYAIKLQTEILSTETSDFLIQIIFLMSVGSMLYIPSVDISLFDEDFSVGV